jgi:hypothetical protein
MRHGDVGGDLPAMDRNPTETTAPFVCREDPKSRSTGNFF